MLMVLGRRSNASGQKNLCIFYTAAGGERSPPTRITYDQKVHRRKKVRGKLTNNLVQAGGRLFRTGA
jgi:hypothetical protein